MPTKLATTESEDCELSWFCGIKTVVELNYIGASKALATPIIEKISEVKKINFLELYNFFSKAIKSISSFWLSFILLQTFN